MILFHCSSIYDIVFYYNNNLVYWSFVIFQYHTIQIVIEDSHIFYEIWIYSKCINGLVYGIEVTKKSELWKFVHFYQNMIFFNIFGWTTEVSSICVICCTSGIQDGIQCGKQHSEVDVNVSGKHALGLLYHNHQSFIYIWKFMICWNT